MDNPLSPDTLVTRSGEQCGSLRWNAASGRLWWADAAGNALLSWCAQDAKLVRKELQDVPQLLAHCASGRMLVGMEKRLCLAEIRTSGRQRAPLVRTLATIDAADPRTLIASGCTDRDGNFVFGTRNTAPAPRAIGSFFQFSGQHGLRRLALPTVVSASAICFNAAGSRMLFADASATTLWQCDYDAGRAAVGDVRPFAQAGAGMAFVDALVDRDDGVWTLQADGSGACALVRHDGAGARLSSTLLAQPALTGMACAGAELDRLMLIGRDGGLHLLRQPGLRGLADTPFDDRRYSDSDLKSQPNPRPPTPA